LHEPEIAAAVSLQESRQADK